jgi:F-type H+-transporting ATPase subunit delta
MSATASHSVTASLAQDPGALSVARVYAVSLLDAAARSGPVDAILEEYGSLIDDVLQPNPDFERLLCTAVTTQEEKLGLIDRVVAPGGSQLLVNTLKVLAKHGRLELVRAVYVAALQEHEQRAGRVRVKVVSATPLSEESLVSVRQHLTQVLSAEPIVETVVDPQVLGGLIVRIGDTVYDGSVRNRLRQLRGKLRERCMNEVQRGRDRFSHPAGN